MNPYGNDLIVDQVIGSAYQVVKYVASNMEILIQLSDFIQTVTIDGLAELIEFLPELQEIHDNLPAIIDSSLVVAASREAIVRSYNEAGFPMNKTESFEVGGTISTARQTLLYEQNGVGYSWGGALPKYVPAGSTPSTTGGIGPSAWVDRSTVLLRQQLTSVSGTLTPVANWETVPAFSDPELGNTLNIQAVALAARSELLRIDVREALRRSYTEAGYTLADGSFEDGGVVSTADGVLLYEAEGKAYSWGGVLPKTVPANSTPANSGGVSQTTWVDRSNAFSGYDVRNFGVVGDGVTIEHVKLQSAIDAVHAAGGGTLEIPAQMVIKCAALLYGKKGVSIKCDPTSWLDFRGAGWLTAGNELSLFGYHGTAGSFITPTADMVKGSNKISVADASLFKIGDMIELSMDSNGSWIDTSVVVTAGQLAIVVGSDQATGSIIISEPLYETLPLANSARIRIIDPIENVVIDGLGIIGNGRNPAGNAEQGLKIYYGRNCHIKNCRFKDVDTQSTGMISCYGGSIKDNRLDTQPLGTINVISYAIAYSSSMHIEISGNYTINYRHGIISSHLARSSGYYGVNRFIDIHDNIITVNFGDLSSSGYIRANGGIATHTDAEFVYVHDNIVVANKYGINFRTANNSAKDNKIYDCSVGIFLTEYWADLQLTGNEFYNCKTPLQSEPSPYEVPRGVIEFSGNTMDGCGGSTMPFPTTVKSKFIYNNNIVRNPANTGGTATITVSNNCDMITKNNVIDVNDTLAIRASGTGIQMIEGNTITSLIPYDTNSAIYITASNMFVIKGNTIILPVASLSGGLARPTKLVAPNSIVSDNQFMKV